MLRRLGDGPGCLQCRSGQHAAASAQLPVRVPPGPPALPTKASSACNERLSTIKISAQRTSKHLLLISAFDPHPPPPPPSCFGNLLVLSFFDRSLSNKKAGRRRKPFQCLPANSTGVSSNTSLLSHLPWDPTSITPGKSVFNHNSWSPATSKHSPDLNLCQRIPDLPAWHQSSGQHGCCQAAQDHIHSP